MKIYSSNFQTSVSASSTTLCTIWHITRQDGELFTFTDHDNFVMVDGQTYIPNGGYNASTIKSDGELSVDNLEVTGYLGSDLITEADLSNGLWDYAAVKIGCVDWKHPEYGVDWQRNGWLGEVSTQGQVYTAELRGVMQRLQQKIGRVYSPLCDAQFGDARCGKNISAYTFIGSVVSSTDRTHVGDTARTEADNYFNNGMITFTSGLNNGASREILSYTVGNVNIAYPFSYPIVIGDTYSIVKGCDKTKNTCRDSYSNVINFRGFAEIPGSNKVISGT